MRIALIYPEYYEDVSTLDKLLKLKIPPVGLLYIAAVLKEKGHDVKIIDNEIEKLKPEELAEKIKDYNPQFIGISVTTPTFKKAREIARHLKKILPAAFIVFGGPHLASFPEISLEFSEIDIGVIGEGEITVCELVDAIQNKKDLTKIKGIVFKKDKQIIKTPPRELIQDLDTLPLPAWSLVNLKKYKDIMSEKKNFSVIMSSRGCPYNCIWCSSEERFGKIFRARSPQNLIKEIKLLYDKYNIREIVFYDDTFTVNRDRIMELCKKLIQEKIKIIWTCRTRVDLVDDELLEFMAKSGCVQIRLGVESGNEGVLKFIRKNITKEKARQAFRLCKKHKIRSFGYFIVGLPTDTANTIQETINFALELDPDYAMFSPALIFSSSNDMFKWAVEKKYIEADYWTRFVRGENLDVYPILNTPEIPKEKIIEYTKRAYKKFYFRPKFILRTIKQINSFKKLIDYSLIAIGFFSKNFRG